MPVVRTTSTSISVGDLITVLDSAAAHVAAKLYQFGTDERTLTDELCDMFSIWTSMANSAAGCPAPPSVNIPSKALNQVLDLKVRKSTQAQEADTGADLAILISSPLGVKRAMLQAKVFDPHLQKMRCDSKSGWYKLWGQLALMRQRNGSLSFLLIYVPSDLLSSGHYTFPTWEQGTAAWMKGSTSAAHGTTVIPVNDLLTRNASWTKSKPVRHRGNGIFDPTGLTLSRLILEMMACIRDSWLPDDLFDETGFHWEADSPDSYPIPYRASTSLIIDAREMDRGEWESVQGELRDALS